VLSDSNKELINAYVQVRDNVEGLIRALSVHQRKYRAAEDRAEYYYTIRSKRLTCSLGGAANLIFMNKTGYNGLFRVNSKGKFNVPHGSHKNPTICDEENLRAASETLQGVELRVADFGECVRRAGPGDFVYFDPPYVPLSETAHFTAYTSTDFGMAEQRRLALTATGLARQGAEVVLSNSGHSDIERLYSSREFRVVQVSAPRMINSVPTLRGPIEEHLVHAEGELLVLTEASRRDHSAPARPFLRRHRLLGQRRTAARSPALPAQSRSLWRASTR